MSATITPVTPVPPQVLGRPVRRVDGPAKVTGQARYAGEYTAAGLLHGYVVSSAVAAGRITAIDASAALAMPGVVTVFTHENRPAVSAKNTDYEDETAPPGEHFRPLADDRVHYSGQPVALVVAQDFETARDASALVKITYAAEPFRADFESLLGDAYVPPKKRSGIHPPPKPRGDFDGAYRAAAVKVDATYRIAAEHNNPMEPHATTCVYAMGDGGDAALTIYDKTQGSQNTQSYVSGVFGLKADQVRVLNPYVGGGFGSGLRPQYQVFLAVAASLKLKQSVRVVLTRDQMFTFTHRAQTLQHVRLGADGDGKLQAVGHVAVAATSTFEDYQEAIVNWSTLLYDAPNSELDYLLVKRNTYTPGDMRAPGAMSGEFAMESAMDELAEKLGIDPVALRLKNYTERDGNTGKAYTSKALRECYAQAAARFGWDRRDPKPRSMREGRELVGYGMASAVWEAMISPTSARATLDADGRLTVASAGSDIGTGTYTIMTQTGAQALGLPIDRVTARLGDSSLPKAPVEGGSWGAASTCSAVMLACEKLRKDLVNRLGDVPGEPLDVAGVGEVEFVDGRIVSKRDPDRSVALADVVRASGRGELSAEYTVRPGPIDQLTMISYTHSANFVEVRVDEQLGVVRVKRIVCAVAAGRILNPKTARSQILGGIVMGLGATLEEATHMDPKLGRFMNHNLAEYHVPVNADIEDIDVIFVDEPDDHTSPIKAKGLGEIGICGTGAAIANAIYHATGRRVRDLPITVEQVLGLTKSV